jgi:cystathionine gamma-synthase
MSAKIDTLPGYAVPPAPRHAVTVHMPGWQMVERYSIDSRSVIKTFHDAYPRAKPHRDIDKVCMT